MYQVTSAGTVDDGCSPREPPNSRARPGSKGSARAAALGRIPGDGISSSASPWAGLEAPADSMIINHRRMGQVTSLVPAAWRRPTLLPIRMIRYRHHNHTWNIPLVSRLNIPGPFEVCPESAPVMWPTTRTRVVPATLMSVGFHTPERRLGKLRAPARHRELVSGPPQSGPTRRPWYRRGYFRFR